MFVCSTGCLISYSVSPDTTGLDHPAYDSSKGMMKLAVDDTTLNTYAFKIYGELQRQTSINAFTDLITLRVVCGSE